jgi:hypothetical protein
MLYFLPKPLKVDEVKKVSGRKPAEPGLPGFVHREEVTLFLRLVDPYEIGWNWTGGHPPHILPVHIHPEVSYSFTLPVTPPGGFHLNKEEIRLAANKFHKIIERPEFVSQEARAK